MASVDPQMELTIIVPTYNEAGNVEELVRRIETTIAGDSHLTIENTEVIFVDDSTDDTPQTIERVAERSHLAISCIHRERATAGLGGAVIVGARRARSHYCLVMDGDLQHPPEQIPSLYSRMRQGDVGVVVASRYVGGGSSSGLASVMRHGASRASILVVKSMFPIRLSECTDPMTGFFMFDTRQVELDTLKPKGFKILFEILARKTHTIAEVPFDFATRYAGESKASFRQGLHLFRQLLQLRFGRMSGFALIGALGAFVNVFLVWVLSGAGMSVFWSTFIAAEVTIVGNFLLQDRYVFGDLRSNTRGFWSRFLRSFTFNNVEALIRIGLVVLIVDRGWMNPTLATAIFLAIAFVIRYVFHAVVVYAPRTHRM